MATTPSRIFVNGMARVYIGPVGTAAPTDPTTTTYTGLVEVGLFTENSLTFTTNPNFNEVRSHQSDYPTRTIQTTDDATISVELQEWDSTNFVHAFGGGAVVSVSDGPPEIFKYSPPALGSREEVMVAVRCQDGDRVYTLIIPRATQVQGLNANLAKGNAATLPLQLKVLGGSGGDAWYWLIADDNAGAWVET